MDLKQLIYTSTAIDNITYQQIQAINNDSCKHNNKNNITGLLLYTGKKFIQILEGTEEEVDYLFSEKIKASHLHNSIKVVSKGTIQQKVFSDWSMNYFVFEQTFFESAPYLKQKYSKPLEQGILYNDKFLVFSLLYDIYTYILKPSEKIEARKI